MGNPNESPNPKVNLFKVKKLDIATINLFVGFDEISSKIDKNYRSLKLVYKSKEDFNRLDPTS